VGELSVDAQRVVAPGADRGVVFQQHMLFLWKTVAGNVECGLKMYDRKPHASLID
jgi:NitT/TauT family transport system ATP-binding protein